MDAMRTNYAVADIEKLNQENTSAFNRLGYDPDKVTPKPKPEDVHRAAQQLFARLKKLNLS